MQGCRFAGGSDGAILPIGRETAFEDLCTAAGSLSVWRVGEGEMLRAVTGKRRSGMECELEQKKRTSYLRTIRRGLRLARHPAQPYSTCYAARSILSSRLSLLDSDAQNGREPPGFGFSGGCDCCVAFVEGLEHLSGSSIRRATVKHRIGRILNAQLNFLGDGVAAQQRRDN